MEPLEWIALIGGIISLLGGGYSIYANEKANKKQREHDEAMAALNHRYRELEAQTSFEREANFNQFQSDIDKMTQAGLSPALMYGGNVGSAAPSVSSVGSSQSAGNVGRVPDLSSFFGKFDPAEYSEQVIQRMQAKTLEEKTKSDILRNNQDILESISRTAENQRNTAFQRKLEKTLLDQENQQLVNMSLQGQRMDFDLKYSQDTRDLDIQAKQLGNKKLEEDIKLVAEKIRTEPVQRAKLAKEMKEIDAAIANYTANTGLIQENIKEGQIGRIMREFGLNARTLNPMLRNGEAFNLPYKTQMSAAKIALQECGFSEFEATNAVLYYMATDPKDVTPSLVNGFSRILASGKK